MRVLKWMFTLIERVCELRLGRFLLSALFRPNLEIWWLYLSVDPLKVFFRKIYLCNDIYHDLGRKFEARVIWDPASLKWCFWLFVRDFFFFCRNREGTIGRCRLLSLECTACCDWLWRFPALSVLKSTVRNDKSHPLISRLIWFPRPVVRNFWNFRNNFYDLLSSNFFLDPFARFLTPDDLKWLCE